MGRRKHLKRRRRPRQCSLVETCLSESSSDYPQRIKTKLSKSGRGVYFISILNGQETGTHFVPVWNQDEDKLKIELLCELDL